MLEKKKVYQQKRLKLKYLKPKYFNCEVMANCKNCIKGYKYNIYKVLKNHNFFNCSKIEKYNLYID